MNIFYENATTCVQASFASRLPVLVILHTYGTGEIACRILFPVFYMSTRILEPPKFSNTVMLSAKKIIRE